MFTLIGRRTILTLSAVLMVLSISLFPLSSQVSAKTVQEMNIGEASNAMGYYYALRVCVRKAVTGSSVDGRGYHTALTDNDLNGQQYFKETKVILGSQFITGDGNWDGFDNCSRKSDKTSGEDNSWVSTALSTLGYSNPRDFLCHLMNTANNDEYASCRNGQGSLEFKPFIDMSEDKREEAYSNTVGKKVFGNIEPLNISRGDAIMQNILYNTFYSFCQPVDYNGGTIGPDLVQKAIKQYQPGPPPTYTDKQVLVKKSRLDMKAGIIEAEPSGMHREQTCNEMPGNISIFADKAKTDLANINSSFFANVNVGTGRTGSDDDPGSSSCAIDGVGWLVCPVINFLADITDGMFKFLADSFLRTDIKVVDTSSGTYKAWEIMRNIANIAFVIVFLIIIYSQLTNMGISNYGLKKLFPRLIVAAILVNASFIICQLAVDLSNILGYGVKSLFDGIGAQVTTSTGGLNADVNGKGFDGWKSIAAVVLVGASGVIVYSALGSLVAILLTSLVVILVIFLLLIIRQMLIILLVVVAPLAFVAYLLPNTEQFFKKWQKLFMTLLLLFPIIGVVFGASSLASTILQTTYTDSENSIQQIVAAGVLIIPLIVIPGLLKASLDGFGKIGATINGAGGKFAGKAGGFGNKMQGAGAGFVAAKTAGRGKFGRAVGRFATGTALPGGKRTYGAVAAKYENEAAGDIISGWERDGTLSNSDELASIAAKDPTSSKGQAALRALATKGEAVKLGAVRKNLTDKQKIAYDRAISSQYANLKAKDPRAVQDMTPAMWGQIKQVEMHGMKDDTLKEGRAESASFNQALIEAATDPEQERNFSADIRAYAQQQRANMGTTPQTPTPTPSNPNPTPPQPNRPPSVPPQPSNPPSVPPQPNRPPSSPNSPPTPRDVFGPGGPGSRP